MDNETQIALYKKLLLREVAYFCRRDPLYANRDINEVFLASEFVNADRREIAKSERSIHRTIEEIKNHNWNAAFFGGMLRTLLVSRIDSSISRRPRDIDIVIQGVKVDEIDAVFNTLVERKTRFGGLKLKRENWQFDVWPLEETRSFQEDSVESPTFEDLPWTTFFNVEAIAVDVWPTKRAPRRIYSGDDQFFRSIIDRTLEINRESNPYPELCVVRALVMAANLKWKIGPKLLKYLGRQGAKISAKEFEDIQGKHYGRVQCSGKIFVGAMEEVQKVLSCGTNVAVDLPLPRQFTLWPEDEYYYERIYLYAMKANTKRKRS